MTFSAPATVPPALAAVLRAKLADSSESQIDFSPLDAYATALARARADALAMRSLGGDYVRKRGLDDIEAEDARAEKKRKVEDEKKKKASASRGVKDLQKADTSGMKKLSAFFAKKPKT